jgi:hypothetical protein
MVSRAVFEPQTQPEIWLSAQHPPNFGIISDVQGIAVVASLTRIAAPNLNNLSMREAQENDFELQAAFQLQPQPEIRTSA